MYNLSVADKVFDNPACLHSSGPVSLATAHQTQRQLGVLLINVKIP